MATFGGQIRRGLPRVAGGEPWPPAGSVAVAELPADEAEAALGAVVAPEAAAPAIEAQVAQPAGGDAATPRVVTPGASSTPGRTVRRGLPRVPGGEPWPPASVAPEAVATTVDPAVAQGSGDAAPAASSRPEATPEAETVQAETAEATPQAETAEATPEAETAGAHHLRRGLPRVAGGEPWPPADFVPAPRITAATAPEGAADAAPELQTQPGPTPEAPAARTAAAVAASAGPDLATPLPFTRTVFPGASARTRPAPVPEPTRIGPFTKLQWAVVVLFGGPALLIAGLMLVFAVRWLLSTVWGVDFLATYPGEYHLPEGAPIGIPAWLGWQHFFNVFLMVLIIRSGLQVRTEKRPSAFWSPRNNKRRKISLNLWFHQALDVLWLVNGVIFVLLLFATGQWMRIVPTSWEVFPNAVSAALQYVSLDWPTENGWVNYNSLQQLAYFTTVFIAAPLAAITGVRMSGVWPKDAAGLNKAYPVEWARALHFPVMLYFVAFIFVHVVLVFATGALRNLNHMYAAQGSVDPDAYAMNWTGFWIFAASILVIVAAWVAARPLVIAPIARLFGKVSGR